MGFCHRCPQDPHTRNPINQHKYTMLDLTKLKCVKRSRSHVVAQCPACYEKGSDRKGDHLIVYATGKFGCACYPGSEGDDHRRRIYILVGAVTPTASQQKPSAKPLSPNFNNTPSLGATPRTVRGV